MCKLTPRFLLEVITVVAINKVQVFSQNNLNDSKLMIFVKRNIQTPENLLGYPCQMYYMNMNVLNITS